MTKKGKCAIEDILNVVYSNYLVTIKCIVFAGRLS
jgi:hypothetical protein